MKDRYFNTARTEIFPHIPDGPLNILELGCGTGATVGAIREKWSINTAFGVELVDDAAAIANEKFDRVWTSNIENEKIEDQIENESLNLILCLDILEHLVDPWEVVRRISPLLAPKGRMIISLPNIRNWKFIRNLLFKGDFHYRDAGLLDRTHLRFFVRQTAVELAQAGGLTLHHIGDAKQYGSLEFRNLLLRASFGRLENLIAKQYLVVVERP